MIDNATVFDNPLIPEGYYYAKIIAVESEPSDYTFPKLLIELTIHPMYGISDDAELSAIIHPTDRSYYHYKNFFNTYMLGVETDEIDKAVGRWGSIQIVNSHFNDSQYSTVRFVYQPLQIRMESWRIGQDEGDTDHR